MSSQKPISNNLALRAYVIGLALGDGNLSNPNGRAVRLRITCDNRYSKLVDNIKKTIEKLLPHNKVSIIHRKKTYIDVSCFSNHWENLLGWYAKSGSKYYQSVGVPEWIFGKELYMKRCLKGLIETDGSIYIDRGYKMVQFVTVIPRLAGDVERLFCSLGYKPRKYLLKKSQKKPNSLPIYHIRLSREVEIFLNTVKPMKA